LGELAVSVSWSEQNIWSATGRGDLFGIRRELKRNVPVDARSDDELTPLHVSAIFNQKEATEILIAGGAKLFLVDAKGNTALHMAAFLGHTDIVRLLLSAGAKPNVRNNLGFSAADLVSVAWNARLEDYYHKVERTLNLTLDLNRIRSERPGILNLLSMPRPGASKTPPSISIWQAAITGNILAVKQHIVAGTDVNSEEDLTGNTPLTLSAIFGHSEVAKLLVEAGADIEHLNKSGDTAIHLACFFCQPDIVKLLVRFGADPNKRNKYNATCIDRVSSELNMEMKAVYRHVYDSLNLQLDFQNIRAARHQIAIFLKEHIAENRVLPKEIPAK
jgi:ankyrin repeat protein